MKNLEILDFLKMNICMDRVGTPPSLQFTSSILKRMGRTSVSQTKEAGD